MTLKRRDFMKATAAGGVLMVTGAQSSTAFASQRDLPPNALGILFDSNLCIGCQACVPACKEANDMPAEHIGDQERWDNPIDLSAHTLNVINMYREGEDFAFIKRQCFHCLEPACVISCPVTALDKDKDNGVVTYNAAACIGCRYCQVVCPYNVPAFDWYNPFPKIHKCQLCDHRYVDDNYAACCEVCPTGASLFGPVEKLRREAHRRLQMNPGEYYDFPVNHIVRGGSKRHRAEHYIQHIYGERELGGAQYLVLAGTEFSKLGLPDVREQPYVDNVKAITDQFFSYLVYPLIALAGLAYLVKKREEQQEEHKE